MPLFVITPWNFCLKPTLIPKELATYQLDDWSSLDFSLSGTIFFHLSSWTIYNEGALILFGLIASKHSIY
jgi:hypothetical protein